MTTNQIMNLDCRSAENQMVIQKVLRLVKPLAKFPMDEDIPIEALEKAIKVMCVKYNMRVRSITTDVYANEKGIVWRADIVDESCAKVMDGIFAISVYELLCKICIKMHSLVRLSRIEQRSV